MAVLNALKMPETIGKTFELGGLNVYSMLEVYEVLYNIIEREPKIAYFNRNVALTVGRQIILIKKFLS